MRLSATALTAVLAVLLVTTGCGDKSAPQTIAPAGFVAVRNASSGFAVAVPSDWVQIPLPEDIDEFDEKSRALIATNEALLPAINQARQIVQFGGKLMVVSPDGNSRINLTVDKAQEDSLEEIARTTVPLLTEGGATELQQSQAPTGAGNALKLTFKYPLPGRGDAVSIANEVQYYLLRGGKSYVLTVINATPEVVQAVADSFRLR
ncbi:MAG: hypothetical protein ACRD2W_02410 [Acidimicrobiales bacterium]